jgi:DHA1 family inner membrane transport protein
MSSSAAALSSPVPSRVLPVLVVAQFAGTSPWFAVNAVMPDLQRELGWPVASVGTLTSALQFGFIAGTLLFALLALADRIPARRLFLACSLLSAASSLAGWALVRDFGALAVCRFVTGFCLAGIYPVGMKLAAMWFPRGLGSALGLLIGALILGSAAGHFLRGLGSALPWPSVMLGVALLAALAGVGLYALLPDPPPIAGAGSAPPPRFDRRALGTLWTDRKVRASVFGYFGHMWELYTMWVLVPLVLATRLDGAALSFAAFAVLGGGAIGCAAGGWWARRVGSATVAGTQLATSGICCLLAPWLIDAPAGLFALWLVVWGITVAGDSPQFSALTAANAPRHAVGSVLTLTNSIGFAISIASIELFVRLAGEVPLAELLPWLAVGPALGLLALAPLWRGKV